MYIRTKTRTKKDGSPLNYSYLVSSKRKYKKPRQKALKYLGKVIDFSHKATTPKTIEDIQTYIKKDYKDIIKDLIKNELFQIGFQNIKGDLFLKDIYKVDLSNLTFLTSHKKPLVIKINDGFLCKHTTNTLINFKFENKTQKECIKLFTNQIISTGINIDKELFILLFKKIYPYEN